VEEVDGRDKLYDGVAEELEALVVLHLGLCLLVLAESAHDVNEHVDSPFSAVGKVDLLVSVFWLPDAAVGQGIARVVGHGPKVLLVRWVRQRELKKLAVLEAVNMA
jgi:hypothetical protein